MVSAAAAARAIEMRAVRGMVLLFDIGRRSRLDIEPSRRIYNDVEAGRKGMISNDVETFR
jgi:hypothetical protein